MRDESMAATQGPSSDGREARSAGGMGEVEFASGTSPEAAAARRQRYVAMRVRSLLDGSRSPGLHPLPLRSHIADMIRWGGVNLFVLEFHVCTYDLRFVLGWWWFEFAWADPPMSSGPG